jgi:4-azaleucine resistance transporter AzlC
VNKQIRKNSVLFALKRTLPMMAGFLPLGLAYGILMAGIGYNWLWTAATSIVVLAGSLQFLMLSFFAGGVPMASVVVMALMLNSRHIFYGIPFIEKFKAYGPWKYWMIFTLADENFSLLCSYKPQEGLDDKTVNLLSSTLVAFYWILFTTLGALVGRWITFDTTGLDFALTALFVVILLDQMKEADSLLPAALAAASSVLCIVIFGADGFILPSLLITVTALAVLQPRLSPEKMHEESE